MNRICPFPKKSLDSALGTLPKLRDLLASTETVTVLHGDMHHDNVLRARRGERVQWLGSTRKDWQATAASTSASFSGILITCRPASTAVGWTSAVLSSDSTGRVPGRGASSMPCSTRAGRSRTAIHRSAPSPTLRRHWYSSAPGHRLKGSAHLSSGAAVLPHTTTHPLSI